MSECNCCPSGRPFKTKRIEDLEETLRYEKKRTCDQVDAAIAAAGSSSTRRIKLPKKS